MVLMLDVPWNDENLPVRYERVTEEIRRYGGPNVVLEDGNVLVTDFFGERNKVPDVSRYRIAEGNSVRHNRRYSIGNNKYLIPHCDISRQLLQDLLREQQILEQQIGNIVLILESPHKDEYQPGNINCPIAPANGGTGHNIDQYLATVLSRIDDQQLIAPSCHVIISNPIQFQTSLHAIHQQSLKDYWETLRDNVWRTLWGNENGQIQNCFGERLDAYNPSLIINACTDALTRHVTKFVREALPDVPLYYETYHPAHNNWAKCTRNNWTICNGTTCLKRILPRNHNASNP